MDTLASIDSPVRGSLNERLTLRVEGWVHAGPRDAELAALEISAAIQIAGETSLRFPRPNAAKALGLPADTPLAAHFSQVWVLTYGVPPLTTPEGLPIHYHLFAICEP